MNCKRPDRETSSQHLSISRYCACEIWSLNKSKEQVYWKVSYLIITHVKKESMKQSSRIRLPVLICLSWWKNINKKINLFEPSLQYCRFGQDGCNNGQKVGDRFTKLNKIGFTMECFAGDFLQLFTKRRQKLVWTVGYLPTSLSIMDFGKSWGNLYTHLLMIVI